MEVTKVQEFDVNSIVKIEQMPVVFEQLEKIGAFIEEKIKDLDKLECTDKNKQEVKNRRTEINNTLNLLEDKRKEIKKKINEPYDLFNKKYEETTKVKLQEASKLLTEKIDKIEDEQKLIKKNTVEKYFNEYCQFLKIDFVDFEQVGLNITLGITDKKLQEQTKAFLDKIDEDLKLIDSQDYKDEILIEYKLSLNVTQAITTVRDRKKQLEEMQKKIEKQKQQKETEQEMVQEVEQVLTAPTKVEKVEEKTDLLEIAFKVVGKREQLKKLVDFLKEEGLDYEKLN